MESSRSNRIWPMLGALVVAALGAVWVQKLVLPRPSNGTRLLAAAVEANKKATYSGDVEIAATYRSKKIFASARIYHSPAGERMEYSKGPLAGVVVINREGSSFTCRGGKTAAVVKSAASSFDASRLGLLLSNYSALVIGQTKLAGRDSTIVELTPRHGDGPRKRLWIDKLTQIVLGTEDKDCDGNLISSSRFVSIRFPTAIPAAMLTLPAGTELTTPMSQPSHRAALSARLGFEVQLPRYISKGYTFEGCRLYRCACNCGHESAQIVYTNGMDTVSVFETSVRSNCASSMCDMRHGASAGDCGMSVSEHGPVAAVRGKDKVVFVVGGLDKGELMRIARSTP